MCVCVCSECSPNGDGMEPMLSVVVYMPFAMGTLYALNF